MTTSEFVARNINVPPAAGGATGFEYGTVVGTNPLDVDDGLSGYVEFTRAGPLSSFGDLDQAITFNAALASGPPVTGDVDSITVDIGFECEGPDSQTLFVRGFYEPFASVNAPATAQPATWTRYLLPTFGSAEEFLLALDPGTTWQLSTATPSFSGYQTKRVTYLRIIVEWSGGAEPMQIIQRGDGLGMGVARVYDTGTRQNSIRVYGTV